MMLAAAALALAARADTIVLKNGRRIHATNVVVEAGRVTFETSAGRLSLPRSHVDHIERGPSTDVASASSDAAQDAAGVIAASPPPAPLSSADAGAIAKAVVVDGSLDRNFLAQLESQADRDGKSAADRVAIAEHFAAQFELAHGDIKSATAHYRRGLIYAPENPGLLLNLSYLLLRQSEFAEALESLEHARRLQPDSPDVAKFLGWAYAGLNKPDLAVAEWKRSLALRPDPEVERALAKARRDQQEEAGYREGSSSHFQLRYNGAAAPPSLVRDILATLESDYSLISSILNYTPPDPIGVVLYTDQAFTDITRAPSWAGALNDGRIRIPVQGLHAMNAELSRELKHELTHSFITQKTRARCPTWIQEGVAQWMEGATASDAAPGFVSLFDRNHQTLALGALESSWLNLPGNDARLAYAWSLSVVEFIIRQGGPEDINRILDQVAAGAQAQAATKAVLHMDYPELEEETLRYLRSTYVR
ncbi:MAG TPA: tetratricopeptide repeat protein [Candidatus Acidoferrales bacterium]|nr:tetratricopeptide repeat protein [Candidatus Acidoferrales bacterium]